MKWMTDRHGVMTRPVVFRACLFRFSCCCSCQMFVLSTTDTVQLPPQPSTHPHKRPDPTHTPAHTHTSSHPHPHVCTAIQIWICDPNLNAFRFGSQIQIEMTNMTTNAEVFVGRPRKTQTYRRHTDLDQN